MNWKPITNQPPDKLVEVRDFKRNTAFAYPTYYPFTMDKKGNITHCDPFWDGGWMNECKGINPPKLGEIIEWR